MKPVEMSESAERRHEGDPTPATSKQTDGGVDLVRLAIPLGIAVVVGAFVALGIEGEALSRLIRNSPRVVAWAMILAVLGVSLPLLLTGSLKGSNLAKVAAVFGSVLLILGTALAIWHGARGVAIREQPDIEVAQLSPVGTDSTVTFNVTATGLSLRSDDHMLLRVLAIRVPSPGPQGPREDVIGPPCYDTSRVPTDESRVLVWAEGGPTATGTVTTSATVTVSQKEFTHLCAVAVLNSQEPRVRTTPAPDLPAENDAAQVMGGRARITGTIIDLGGATTTPVSSATPSPTTGSVHVAPPAEEGMTIALRRAIPAELR